MKKFDVIILGGGHVGIQMVRTLSAKGVSLGVVNFSEPSDTNLYRFLWSFQTSHLSNPIEEPPPSGVHYFTGPFNFESSRTIRVQGEIIAADKFILSTGSRPIVPAVPGLYEIPYDLPLNVLVNPKRPETVVIYGSDPLGLALAGAIADSSTVILLGDGILPNEEPEIAASLKTYLASKNVRVESDCKLASVTMEDNKEITATLDRNGAREDLICESLVLAQGSVPNSRGFGLEKQGVYINERDQVVVNENMETSARMIWAAGSVTGASSLLMEDYQGEVAANNVTAGFFGKMKIEVEPLPTNIPTRPAFARVGLTAREASAKFKDIRSTVTFIRGEERAAEFQGEAEGIIKIVGKRKTGEILGVHILAPHAEEAILYFNLAMKAGISLRDLDQQQYYLPLTAGAAIYQSIQQWTSDSPPLVGGVRGGD